MIRKLIASAALAATAMIGFAGTASAAVWNGATVRHSDYLVKTVNGPWVAEDQLTGSQLADLAAGCSAIQTVVVIAFPRTVTEAQATFVLADGRFAVSTESASAKNLSAANSNQVGLSVPSSIGPDAITC